MCKIPQITEAEYEIMKVIWDKNPISTNEITEKVMREKQWSDRTIHTLITRLDKKGAIGHDKEGKLYFYFPLIKKAEYIKKESRNFIDKFFNGAAGKLVMNFIDNDILSEDDIKELRDILGTR